MTSGLQTAIENFEKLHDKLLSGEHIEPYRKFCSNNNVNTLISDAKFANSVDKYPEDEGYLRLARNNLDMKKAMLEFLIKEPKYWDRVILNGVVLNRVYRLTKKMKIKPDIAVFFEQADDDFNVFEHSANYATKIFKLYYEYKLKNFHADYLGKKQYRVYLNNL